MTQDKVLGKWTTAIWVGQSVSGKTQVWRIRANADDMMVLGQVRWYGRWRQYVFFPSGHTLWNPDCLDEVSTFVRASTVEHPKFPGRPDIRTP
jgi:hypothetical protein